MLQLTPLALRMLDRVNIVLSKISLKRLTRSIHSNRHSANKPPLSSLPIPKQL